MPNPLADLPRPHRTLIIAGTPRAGTNYLCALISATQVLGHPAEYLTPHTAARLTRSSLRDAKSVEFRLRLLFQRGLTPNGILSFKVWIDQLDELARAGYNVTDLFPAPCFVFIRRRDILAQAISFEKAAQTKSWTSLQSTSSSPRYKPRSIYHALLNLAAQDASWRVYFARNGIEPYEIYYEDLIGRERTVLEDIASNMGITDLRISENDILRNIVYRKQSDHVNVEWRKRFLSDFANLNNVDILSPPYRKTGLLRRIKRAVEDLFRDRRPVYPDASSPPG